ncbi:hypothetical protein [Paenibacillus agricola]|uniref:Uncharacterized protein n=1 Tax=Paenibacillus agricola TaxID=2716264 RepID=A0ABX0JA42_9BACL|nr:hypothetical protein [Paenibacillus agricola]NHN33254.1 hypothetical protein [Paenibacillus agricola]
MFALIISQINVFMTKQQLKPFMNNMRDIIQIASETEIKKEGRKTVVSITIVTPISKYLDSVISRVKEMGFDVNEKRGSVREIEKSYVSANEVCIWQIEELHLSKLSYDEFIQKHGQADLSCHKRVFGSTLAGLNINQKLKENKLVKDVYHTFNFLRPSQCLGILIQVGDIIQIRDHYYYVNQFEFKLVKI